MMQNLQKHSYTQIVLNYINSAICLAANFWSEKFHIYLWIVADLKCNVVKTWNTY